MTPKEFMIEKNKIFFNLTGITLIPKDQLVDIELVPLSTDSASEACPYCMIYNYTDDCTGCPMAEAGNNCKQNIRGTFRRVSDKVIQSGIRFTETPELVNLVVEYNVANSFKPDDARELQDAEWNRLNPDDPIE